jgi:hypothetical protein
MGLAIRGWVVMLGKPMVDQIRNGYARVCKRAG